MRIPAFLRPHRRWLRWRLERRPGASTPTRRPQGSTLRPEEWSTLDELGGLPPESNAEGLGFVFTGRVPYAGGGFVIGFDMDACVDPATGAVMQWARDLLEATGNGYAHLSPSGTGIHAFRAVLNPPAAFPVAYVAADPPPGVNKRPQVQVFGCGPAGYLTMTGKQIPGTSDVPSLLQDLSDLEALCPHAKADAENVKPLEAHGEAPSFPELDAAVAAQPGLRELCESGDWHKAGHQSASEGWYRIVQTIAGAARGHVEDAADWLAGTAYGRGAVDSRDPDKYARRDWVISDLTRVWRKREGATSTAFADGFDCDAWRPSAAATAPPAARGWFLTLAEYEARSKGLQWLFRGLLPSTGLAAVHGAPSAGKTTVAVDLAVHVALGRDWNGYECRRPGWVLYVAGEGGPGLGARVEAARRRIDPEGKPEGLRLLRSDRPAQFTADGQRKSWTREAEAAMARVAGPGERAALIVVDTLARNFGPGNENAAEDMGKFIDEVEAFGRAVGAVVLLVHHEGRADRGRARGSSALDGALDASFEVRRLGAEVLEILPHKAKDWQAPAPMTLAVEIVEVGTDAEDKPITAVRLGGPVRPQATAALDPVAAFAGPENPAPPGLAWLLRAIRAAGPSPAKVPREAGAGVGLSPKQLRRLVDDAIASGLVSSVGERRWRSLLLTAAGAAELDRLNAADAASLI